MSPGQRADILVDLTGGIGQNFQLMSFASELPNAVYGAAQPGMGAGATASLVGYTSNPLNGNDFQLLDITVVAQTASPITTIPSTLASYTRLQEGTENITRNLTFTSTGAMGDLNGPFVINNATFDMSVINYTIPLNNIEIWSFTNSTPIAHPFHIHDVQFFILDINGVAPSPEMQGLNDVILIPAGQGTARFIAQFSDFADNTIPFMYHCHMLTHEDMGMMGQFIVSVPVGIDVTKEELDNFTVYPNPTIGEVRIEGLEENGAIKVMSIDGKLIREFEFMKNEVLKITIPETRGTYLLEITTVTGKRTTRKVVRN
jgi:bilirubin oxidase